VRNLLLALALMLPIGSLAIHAQPVDSSQTAASAPGCRVLELIARTVKSPVERLSAEDVRRLMIARYRSLRLMDQYGKWLLPELETHAETLLADRLDGKGLCRFVDLMADVAVANPYVMTFLERANDCTFLRLREKIAAEGDRVFPDLVAHAEVLDRLTTVMIEDYRVSEACRAHWYRVGDSNPRFRKAQGIAGRIKTISVNLGIDKINKIHRQNRVGPHALTFLLSLNILEAVVYDFHLAVSGPGGTRKGHLANARAGLALVFRGLHHAGPTRISANGKLIEIQPKNVKEWDDLYATWNMSFVTLSGTWPYWIAKLVIPSVNDYASDPGSYINRRAMALEIQLYANGFDFMDGKLESMDWTDAQLNRLWGVTNLESARRYSRDARYWAQQFELIAPPCIE